MGRKGKIFKLQIVVALLLGLGSLAGCAAHEYTAAPAAPAAAATPAAAAAPAVAATPAAAAAPTASSGQMERDRAECEYQSELATANMEAGWDRGWRKGGLTVACMKLKG
jgi:hypothetical protein